MGVGPLLALVNIEEEERRNAIYHLRLQKKVLRDISNPFLLDAEYFRKHYRLTPHLAYRLIDMLNGFLEPERVSGIPSHLQVLMVLKLLGGGSFQKGVYHDFLHPMSQSSISRCLERVVNAILMLGNQFIQFPDTPQDRHRVSMDFQRYNRIPGILGIIDCVKVCFWRPTENEEAFYNYHVGTSMNVQIVADCNYIISNIRICPGSNTDQFVWNFSDLKHKMAMLRRDEEVVRNEGSYYLLGDNGYSPSPIILTPVLNAEEGSPEAAYTRDLVTTRCKIEQCFGILTSVWFAINRSKKLHYGPDKVAKIIHACCILHNFRKLNGMVDEIPAMQPDLDQVIPIRDLEFEAGIAERARLIQEIYNFN